MSMIAFCVCDANYIDPAIIALGSFTRYHPDLLIRVYVEAGANYQRLRRALIGRRVEFCEVDLPQLPEHEGVGGAYSALFFSPEALPAYAQRIAALAELRTAADIIINFDLDTLCLGTVTRPAVMERAGRDKILGVSERKNRDTWLRGIGMQDFAPMPRYINTGLGIYGADAIPAGIMDQYRAFLREFPKQIYCPEQDFINYVLSAKIENLPPGYNLMFTHDRYRDTAPVLVHFVGHNKPWAEVYRPGRDTHYFHRYAREVSGYDGIVSDQFMRAVMRNSRLEL